jgi:hypothetical protein
MRLDKDGPSPNSHVAHLARLTIRSNLIYLDTYQRSELLGLHGSPPSSIPLIEGNVVMLPWHMSVLDRAENRRARSFDRDGQVSLDGEWTISMDTAYCRGPRHGDAE